MLFTTKKQFIASHLKVPGSSDPTMDNHGKEFIRRISTTRSKQDLLWMLQNLPAEVIFDIGDSNDWMEYVEKESFVSKNGIVIGDICLTIEQVKELFNLAKTKNLI